MPVNLVFRSANLIIAPLTFLYLPAITVVSPNRNITNRWTGAAVAPFAS
jgi:hypothetical protein